MVKDDDTKDNKAAELIRHRIDALLEDEIVENQDSAELSLVDRFWHNHHDHPNPHSAWRDYYDSLSDNEKNELWEHYHLSVDKMSGLPPIEEPAPQIGEPTPPVPLIMTPVPEPKNNAIEKKRKKKEKRQKSRAKKAEPKGFFRKFFKSHIWPIMSAAIIVSCVWLVFNNELVIASVKQYISPGNSDLTPAIIDPSSKVGKAPKAIIPRFNVDVPVVYDVKTRDENAIQTALEDGAVHYAGTSYPGEVGNSVIVGHSSNNFFNRGKYKYAFVLLGKLEKDDTFILNYKGTRYVYKVFNRQVVEPTDFSVLQNTGKPLVTLITCDPPGTAWRRMVIQGKQISPDPSKATNSTAVAVSIDENTIIPGNSRSLWERFWEWVF